jgi:polymerase delta-interacting protein 2
LKLFLHNKFGYRGVVLFPWKAHVFDKSDESTEISSSSHYDKIAADELDGTKSLEKAKAKKLTYYQVLIDSRDQPYIRSMPESVTFLTGSISNRSVYSIYGLDYVSQQDIIPYSSSEKQPIFHGKINYILFTILKLIK